MNEYIKIERMIDKVNEVKLLRMLLLKINNSLKLSEEEKTKLRSSVEVKRNVICFNLFNDYLTELE